jgi:hypothetical protein
MIARAVVPSGPVASTAVVPLASTTIPPWLRERLIACYGVDILMVLFEKIGNVEKCVALQANIDKRRLHPRQNARDASFMDAACQRIFVGALEVNFHQLIVFDQRHSGLVPVGRDHQFLTHRPSLPARIWAGFQRTRRGRGKELKRNGSGSNWLAGSGAVTHTLPRTSRSPARETRSIERLQTSPFRYTAVKSGVCPLPEKASKNLIYRIPLPVPAPLKRQVRHNIV